MENPEHLTLAEKFCGIGWIGILRGLGAAPLALGVSRIVHRPSRCSPLSDSSLCFRGQLPRALRAPPPVVRFTHRLVSRLVSRTSLCSVSALRAARRVCLLVSRIVVSVGFWPLCGMDRVLPLPEFSVFASLRLRPRFAARSWFLRHLSFFPLRVVSRRAPP